jgi:hypothetical protein
MPAGTPGRWPAPWRRWSPAGLWALIVLRRDDVMETFSLQQAERRRPEPPPVNVAAIRGQMRGPAIALTITAGAGLIVLTAVGCIAAAVASRPPFHSEAFLFFVVIPTLLCLPFTGLMLLGSWKMRSLEVYGLAVATSIVAVLPLHPTVLLTFPVGVWAIALLARREVRAAFDRVKAVHGGVEEPADPPLKPHQLYEAARSRLRVPAVGFMVTGVVNAALAVSFGMLAAMEPRDFPPLLSTGLIVSALATGALLIAAGVRMLRLRSYGWVLAAAGLAVLPTSPAWPLSIIFGMHALVVLASRDVRREFEDESTRVQAFSQARATA